MKLSKQDTSVIKGIAICAMLCHHLYWATPEGVAPYIGVYEWIGWLGKVCVAMFLFCSGYGLTAQYKPVSFVYDLKFVAKRLKKFYLNYWVIFIVFVPITIFVFHRSLTDAYGEGSNIILCFILDVFGLQGASSYNTTWWFNQLIIILYVLYPLLYRVVRVMPWMAAIGGLMIMRFVAHIPYNPAEIFLWQFPFVLGMVWKLYEDKLPKIQEWLGDHNYILIGVSLMLLCGTVILRMYPVVPHWGGLRMDGFVTAAIALCVVSVIRRLSHLYTAFSFLGKHSMNIYMIHTFFNAYWCPKLLHTCEYMRGGGVISFFS